MKRLSEDDAPEIVKVLNESFKTVADEFGFTRENAPTNAAFVGEDSILESFAKGIIFFGIYSEAKLAGTVAVEKSSENPFVYYLERLAVLPSERHKGYGKELLDYAFREAASFGCTKVSIGIIDENTVLKKWYLSYGFKETSLKHYEHLPFDVCFMEKDVNS